MSSPLDSLPYLSAGSDHLQPGSSYESLSIDDGFGDTGYHNRSGEESDGENNSAGGSTSNGSGSSCGNSRCIRSNDAFMMPGSMEGMGATERLETIQQILHLFFNNKIREAESAVEPYKDTCQHFSHAKIQFVTISSLLTLDPVSRIACLFVSCFPLTTLIMIPFGGECRT